MISSHSIIINILLTYHIDDGGGHGVKVHWALPLVADVGPHHGLVGVVQAKGHGVAAHVQPL